MEAVCSEIPESLPDDIAHTWLPSFSRLLSCNYPGSKMDAGTRGNSGPQPRTGAGPRKKIPPKSCLLISVSPLPCRFYQGRRFELPKPHRPLNGRSPSLPIILLLLLCGQCPNPGPSPSRPSHPCSVCNRSTAKTYCFQCNRCTHWVHRRCSGLQNDRAYRTGGCLAT